MRHLQISIEPITPEIRTQDFESVLTKDDDVIQKGKSKK